MSAFICSSKLIANVAKVITVIANADLEKHPEFAGLSVQMQKNITKKNGSLMSTEEVYKKLYALNVDSVNYCYNENTSKKAPMMPDAFEFNLDTCRNEDAYKFTCILYSNIRCLRYQSCERSTKLKWYLVVQSLIDGFHDVFPTIKDDEDKLDISECWSTTIIYKTLTL